jgi:thiol-disulfide isomerase/thioredoxin
MIGKRLWQAVLVLVTFTAFEAQGAKLPQAGQTAPGWALEKILQAPVGASANLQALRGKVVVLEFWATWCAPCISEIPSINKLASELPSSKVQFLSVTDEPASTVEPFLRRKPIKGWIGIDTSSKIFDQYGAMERPTTIVIDPQGRVISNSVHPHQLSAAQLLQIADNRAHSVSPVANLKAQGQVSQALQSEKENQLKQAHLLDFSDAAFYLTIKRAEGGSKNHIFNATGSGDFAAIAVDSKLLLHYALGYHMDRITTPESMDSVKFSVLEHLPGVNQEERRQFIAAAYESAAAAHLLWQTHDEDVLLLRAVRDVDTTPKPDDYGLAAFSATSGLQSYAPSLDELASAIESAAGKAVIAESSGLSGCRTTFAVQKGDIETLRRLLESNCGYTLVSAVRPVERVEIRR